MLEYFEKLSNDEGCNLVKVYGNIVYIRLGDKVIEYNIDVKRVTNEYKSTLVSYQESTTDTFMIKDTYTYTLFTKNNKYVFDLTDDYTTYFIKDNIILFQNMIIPKTKNLCRV